MFEHLKEKFPELTDYRERYTGLYRREKVPARTILLQEGELSKRAFFIKKCCLQAWFNNNGKDIDPN